MRLNVSMQGELRRAVFGSPLELNEPDVIRIPRSTEAVFDMPDADPDSNEVYTGPLMSEISGYLALHALELAAARQDSIDNVSVVAIGQVVSEPSLVAVA
jgi:hypothetical protein